MASFDLIPFPNKVENLFILESPHSNEIKNKYPCAGETGINMSKQILSDIEQPFGKLLYEKNIAIDKYGIFNSCHFPLGLPNLLESNQKEISQISEYNYNDFGSREEYYHALIGFLKEIPDLENKTNYKERLEFILNGSSTITNLIICGFIAQAFFIRFYNIQIPKYNTITSLKTKSGRELNVLFVKHPSPKNGNWDFRIEKLEK